MLTLIENAEIFSPEPLGTGSVLVAGGRILHVGAGLPDVPAELLHQRIDLDGAPLVPGFIDAHVHVTGGGGEHGFCCTFTPGSCLNQTIADNIVTFRNENGRFKNRKQLLKVPRLGAKGFEQAAGFLRLRGGDNPLDASAVHPESYSVVQRIAESGGSDVHGLIGNTERLNALNPRDFTDEQFGLPTVTDIIAELNKPGRDPRPTFKTATFKDGVEKIADLRPDMELEGVVTNVTNFGAFVDVGVHQDGLVHISMLANRFVKDPHEVVKAGDVVRVKVLEVDEKRKRIALTMKLEVKTGSANEKAQQRDAPVNPGKRPGAGRPKSGKPSHKTPSPRSAKPPPKPQNTAPVNNAFADAFARAKDKR